MTPVLYSVAALLLSVVILLAGHGLQLSLIPIRAAGIGFSNADIGALGSAYFGGFLLGCIIVPALVSRVGHVRVFLVLTAVAAGALLGIGVTSTLPVWLLLRLATGFAISGLYLVIESWLNELAPSNWRGALLGVYTMLVLGAMALGQLLLGLAPADGGDIITFGAILLLLAAVPVGVSRARTPMPVPAFRFSIRDLFAASRAATVTVFLSGLITGALWTMAPAMLSGMHFDAGQVGQLISCAIVAGAVAQWPLGRLSDRIDRRLILLFVMLSGALLCVFAGWRMGNAFYEMALAMAWLGGCSAPIYALSLALANDSANGAFLKVGTSVLLVNSLGAMAGPSILASALASTSEPERRFFLYCAACFMLGTLVCLIMRLLRPADRAHHQPFAPGTDATQGALELDPRDERGGRQGREAAAEAAAEAQRR